MTFFYPELTLGADALSYSRQQEVSGFLVEVVRQRGFPLHVANLWNALYFRWDLEQHRYVAATIEPARIPRREMNTRDDPLPVGAFVRVKTKTKAGDLWAEVIYKEGADPDVKTDYLPPALCGRSSEMIAIDGRQAVVLRERYVLDIGAFGLEQNKIRPAAYQRLLQRARWLDERGHLVLEAVYAPEDAQLEDVDLYVNYLLDHHREGLLAFCFSEEPSEEELREAVIRSFASVRDLALARPEICSWRQKLFFDGARFREQIADPGDRPLAAGDLSHLFGSLGRLRGDRRICYMALGPYLDDLLSRDGYEDEERALMRGPAYVRAVAYANSYISDRLEGEAPRGLLEGGIHLRLDDDWQAGGVWRCEQIDGPSSITFLPPDLPLHLGLAEAEGVAESESEAGAQPEAVTVHSFTVALTGRDIAGGVLRLPPRVVGEVSNSQPTTLRLRHDGDYWEQEAALDRATAQVNGIPWPPSFYPGIRVYGNIERGGSIIAIRTKVVIEPVVIDGVELRYEFIDSVYQRETAGPQLSGEERHGATTINELIYRAFRRHGRDVGEEGKALTYGELVRAVLGPGARASESGALALALAVTNLERREADYIWRPRMTRRTSVSDRSVLEAYGVAQNRRRLRRIVRHHYVPMYLRHMRRRGVGAEKIHTYAEARVRYGMQGILPEELPDSYTWVEPYECGTPPTS
ncbi:MAG: hypothetical protein IBX61_07245 [Thermoleophilia bacterium]|nr:hypothetical protein [Thermoleophilia bacterium]